MKSENSDKSLQYERTQTLLFIYIAAISGLFAVFSQREFLPIFFFGEDILHSEILVIAFLIAVAVLFIGLSPIVLAANSHITTKERETYLRASYLILRVLFHLFLYMLFWFVLMLVLFLLISLSDSTPTLESLQPLPDGTPPPFAFILTSLITILAFVAPFFSKQICKGIIKIIDWLSRRKRS